MKTGTIILLIAAACFVWWFVIRGGPLVLVSPDGGKRVTADLKEVVPGEALVIEVANNETKNNIVVISMPRGLAQQLAASPPQGFVEELLPLTEEEMQDKKSVEFAEKYNAETLRWAGRFELAPDAVSELRIPIKNTAPLNGRIDFQYESKIGFGGSMSFFHLPLASPPSARAFEKPADLLRD